MRHRQAGINILGLRCSFEGGHGLQSDRTVASELVWLVWAFWLVLPAIWRAAPPPLRQLFYSPRAYTTTLLQSLMHITAAATTIAPAKTAQQSNPCPRTEG